MKRTFILFAVLMALPLISAATEINVRTLPNYDVSIFVLDPTQVYYLLDSFHLTADGNGLVSAVYEGTEEKVKINVKVFQDDTTLILEKFDSFDTGFPLYLQVIPDDVLRDYKKLDDEKAAAEAAAAEAAAQAEAAAAAAAIEETETAPEEPASQGLSGSSIFNGEGGFPKSVYFIIGGAVLIIIVIFILKNRISAVSGLLSIPRTDKRKDLNFSETNGSLGKKNREIEKAERKIKEVQMEINRLKNQDKIEAAERKIEQDRIELKKLREGG
ncbi:hypothetical protein HY450_03945 [Candidatus Pacearchaeota archaeon]|nr:hypothetical protein [Candidatus Pacearchaeota archaeon]